MRGIGCALLASCSLACGGETAGAGNDTGGTTATGGTASGGVGASGGSTTSGGSGGFAGSAGASNGGTGGVSVGCPVDPPNVGDACTTGAAVCVYSCADCFCPDGTWHCNDKTCIDPCSQPGLVCGAPGNQCLCWGGKWSCASDPGQAPLDPKTLPSYVSDGETCSEADLVCHPKGQNSGACSCKNGNWSCAPDVGPNSGCPANYDSGQACTPVGMLCTKSGFCPPTCVCQVDATWDCAVFTPC